MYKVTIKFCDTILDKVYDDVEDYVYEEDVLFLYFKNTNREIVFLKNFDVSRIIVEKKQ